MLEVSEGIGESSWGCSLGAVQGPGFNLQYLTHMQTHTRRQMHKKKFALSVLVIWGRVQRSTGLIWRECCQEGGSILWPSVLVNLFIRWDILPQSHSIFTWCQCSMELFMCNGRTPRPTQECQVSSWMSGAPFLLCSFHSILFGLLRDQRWHSCQNFQSPHFVGLLFLLGGTC